MRRIIIFILLVAAVGYGLYAYWPILSPYLEKVEEAKPVETAPAAAPEPPAATGEKTPEAIAATEAVSTAEVKLVDPFALRIEVTSKAEQAARAAPPAAAPSPGGEKPKEVKPAGPRLEGVWIDSGMRIAFISGQALNVGGAIMGWKVVSISTDRVVLRKGSVSKTLRLEGK